MRRLSLAAGALLAGLTFAGHARAALLQFESPLGPEVFGAAGTGFVTVILDTTAHTLSIDATFSGLSGITSVAHIHCCTAVPNAGTVAVAVTPGTLPGFPVGVQSGTYSVDLDLTLAATYTAGFVSTFGGGTIAGAEAALLAGMQAERAYFNIHSDLFPGGEIRGFLTAAPEPTSLALLAAGLLGLGVLRRRAA